MTNDITMIWNEFNVALKKIIYRKVQNQQDTEDILQDVFIKIILNQEKISKSTNVKVYIFTMVRNAVNDHFRNQKSSHPILNSENIFSEEEETTINAKIAECCLKPFTDQLPKPYREAILLYEFNGMSQKDLATYLNISYSGAKSRVQRGREKLKSIILSCCQYEADSYGNLRLPEEKPMCC